MAPARRPDLAGRRGAGQRPAPARRPGLPIGSRPPIWRPRPRRPRLWRVSDYCTRTEAEAARLVELVTGADPSTPVTTCPGWTMADLVTHVGTVHRWALHIVTTRRQERIWSKDVPNGLAEGAARRRGVARGGRGRTGGRTARHRPGHAPVVVRRRPERRVVGPADGLRAAHPPLRRRTGPRSGTAGGGARGARRDRRAPRQPAAPPGSPAGWRTLGAEGATIHLHATDTTPAADPGTSPGTRPDASTNGGTDTHTLAGMDTGIRHVTDTATDTGASARGEWTLTQGPGGRITSAPGATPRPTWPSRGRPPACSSCCTAGAPPTRSPSTATVSGWTAGWPTPPTDPAPLLIKRLGRPTSPARRTARPRCTSPRARRTGRRTARTQGATGSANRPTTPVRWPWTRRHSAVGGESREGNRSSERPGADPGRRGRRLAGTRAVWSGRVVDRKEVARSVLKVSEIGASSMSMNFLTTLPPSDSASPQAASTSATCT